MTVASQPHLDAFVDGLRFPLDSFQRTACESLEAGRSVLVAAPTGAGKTTIAEFAIRLARGRDQARVFYTTPIKALSNQKFRELISEYGEDEVGLLTGDVNIRGDAPIIVMTTEVLRNMIYEESGDLDDLSYVILDEVHFLGDRHRGAVWEEIILHLPRQVKLVSLSATVSNAEEFGDWMHTVRGDTDVIVSDHRPVPLFQHVLTQRALMPMFVDRSGRLVERGRLNPELIRLERPSPRGRGGHPRRRARVSHAEVVRVLEMNELLPGIVFVFSRKGCDQAVRQCLYEGVRLTSRDERDEIRRIVRRELKDVADEDLQVLGYAEWVSGLERGVAAHHAGMFPAFKHVVEVLFQRKLLKVVFATETLALGINMPARSVTIEQLEKFNGESRVPLTPGEFTQLTGRAGRRGIDHEGHAIILWESQQDLDVLATLASNRLYPLKSTFVPTYNMTVNLLQRLNLAQVRSTLELSFAQFQADRAMVDLAQEIKDKQTSLAGYETAMHRARGSERKRWEDRHRKLTRQINRGLRQMSSRTGTIARTFDRVAGLLTELDYLEESEETELTPTVWGGVLRRIYGDRDLLVAECLRYGVWDRIAPDVLAAIACSLVYEPRRDDEFMEISIPKGQFRGYFEDTLAHWERLDDAEGAHRIQQKPAPHPGLAKMMIGWARGDSIARTLEVGGLGPGDFVRVAKQTVDLLDQISGLDFDSESEILESLARMRETARDAKRSILRGIVDSSRSA